MQLACILLEYGYFSALGTTERDGSLSTVKRGVPLTCDLKGGVFVVYDEEGRPWIKSVREVTKDIVEELKVRGIKKGAYVPHSRDDGNFIRKIVPNL